VTDFFKNMHKWVLGLEATNNTTRRHDHTAQRTP
jgi:hypothetical protein